MCNTPPLSCSTTAHSPPSEISLFKSASAPRSNCPYRRCRWPRENARLQLASDHSHALLPLPCWPWVVRRRRPVPRVPASPIGSCDSDIVAFRSKPATSARSRSWSNSAFTDDGTRTVIVSVRSSFLLSTPIVLPSLRDFLFTFCAQTRIGFVHVLCTTQPL